MKAILFIVAIIIGLVEMREPFCFCPMIYSPVCGSDGVTYGNEKCMRCEQGLDIEVIHYGPCEDVRFMMLNFPGFLEDRE